MKRKSLDPTISPISGGNNKLRWMLIALLCAGIVFGCAQIRKVTYPNDFVYLERKELRSKMALLSFYMRHLDETLLEDPTVSSDQQQRILELLYKVQDLTYELGGGVTTNHLVIDDHIDQFKLDVSNAIRNARAEPPNYFALGRLTGSCTGCHQFRD
ncbi:MAG: hypothetical protein JSU67_02010 [Gammaproteobacteria bacterium]|nr:MAG: hypothetical protein JSU67_02010 [Gammaproteobacteria bacterium]